MSNFRKYGKNDDVPVQDGDAGFIGFASGVAADSLPPGVAAFAQNIRSRKNTDKVRPGNKLLLDGEDIECDNLILPFTLGCEVTAASLTRSGSTATFVATAPVPFADQDYIAMECADQAEYNIDATITLISPTTFTYQITGTPVSPATGDPIASSGPRLGSTTDDGVRHSIEWTDPQTKETRTLRARGTFAELIDLDEPQNKIILPYPGAETIEASDPAWLTQVNDRVILHRGFQLQALEWFNDDATGFVLKAETGSVKWNMPRSSWSVWLGSNQLLVPLESIPVELTSVTRVGLLATATTLKDHGLEPGDSFVLTDSNAYQWDGLYDIATVTSPTTFEFNLEVAPPTLSAGGFVAMAVTRFDEVIVSDTLDTDTYDNINARYRFNAGGADHVIFAYPWVKEQVLIFMRHSVHIIKGISVPLTSIKDHITLEVGCSDRGSVAGSGPIVIFRQENNLYQIKAGRELELQWLKAPISYPDIEDIMENVTEVSSHFSWAVYFNNRYWIALPFDGEPRNTKILVYHVVREQWESVDTVPTGFNPDFMHVARYGNKDKRIGSTFEGALYVFDELTDEEADDEIGPLTTTPIPTAIIPGAVDTRLYTGSIQEIKRWATAQCSMFLTDQQSVTVTPIMEDPDITGETKTFTGTTTKDPLKRQRIGRQGRGLQLQWRTFGGRPELRNTLVEGAIKAREVKGHN